MKYVGKLLNWSIKQCENICILGSADTVQIVEKHVGEWIEIGEPKEVQEALIEKGLLSDALLEDGEAEYCKWVAEKDWAYKCMFTKNDINGTTYLHFKGLDTVSDIYINGVQIANSKTMYLPLRIDVTDKLKAENELFIYFHSPYKIFKIYAEIMPDDWKGIVSPGAMLRKSSDYGDYTGVKPCFVPIGIFNDVCLETEDVTEITNFDINTTFNIDYSEAIITLKVDGSNCEGNIEVEFQLSEENGTIVIDKRCGALCCRNNGWNFDTTMKLQNPKLWWPKNYGDHPLYSLKASVYVNGIKRDEIVRITGFREVKLVGSLKFMVNGKLVRFWGANIGPISGVSNRWNPELAVRLIELAEKCNMNALRLWGLGKIYGEELYLEADKRGFMLWQDFFTGSSQIPDNEEYKKLFLDEAEYLVRRIKHHPSIMIWCGGNENIYMTEYNEQKDRKGHEILTHGFRELCLKIDPYRYYHDTSPSQGKYANDPQFGDTHGNRAFKAYIPGEESAVFFSEDIRTFTPPLKSLKRFIKDDDLWPKDYIDTTTFGVLNPMPKAWRRRTTNFTEKKFGPIEQFYDATDPESLIYKFAAAAGLSYYNTIANCRHGKPFYESASERKCNGYILWKLNNTWPTIYCGIVDYYMEPHIPYYFVKRAFEPFLLSFDVKDHIYVWGVNDTELDVVGQLTIKLFSLSKNKVYREISFCAAIPVGKSRIIENMDELGFIWRDTILFATMDSFDGKQLGKAVGYVDIEKHLVFPAAKLELSVVEDYIVITTDMFAHCIELSGDDNGDKFGWYFEDNYFDLLPFETKKVKISGSHGEGMISAKAHYSSHISKINYFKRD